MTFSLYADDTDAQALRQCADLACAACTALIRSLEIKGIDAISAQPIAAAAGHFLGMSWQHSVPADAQLFLDESATALIAALEVAGADHPANDRSVY